MCGRYTLTTPPIKIRELTQVKTSLNTPPLFNVAPPQDAPVLRVKKGSSQLVMLRWGLIPPWAKDATIASKLINARFETAPDKPSFRAAYGSRRCLVPADGFYEWRSEHGVKQAFRIGLQEGKAFAFAGLWEAWKKPTGPGGVEEVLETFTILTTQANQKLAPIHHRMPVIVSPSNFDMWLNGEPKETRMLGQPYPSEEMIYYRVSSRVNNVKNNDAECVAPVISAD